VHDIEDRQRALLHLADGTTSREGVRTLLMSLHRVALRGTGGVYFVPQAAPDAERTLKGLRAYIKGLLPWKTGQLGPSCNVVRLNGDDAGGTARGHQGLQPIVGVSGPLVCTGRESGASLAVVAREGQSLRCIAQAATGRTAERQSGYHRLSREPAR